MPHEIDFVGGMPVSRHGNNNLLCARALELQQTREHDLSARGKHHRSTDHFISLIVMLSNQLDHSSRYEKKTLAMGHIYFQRGMAYAFIGSGDKAIKDYGMCIEIFNQHKQPCSQAYFNRSILRYDEGGKEGLAAALEDVSTAISQDPGNITYFKNRALLLRKKDDFLKSITDVEFVNRLTKKKIETEKKSGRRLSLTSTKPSSAPPADALSKSVTMPRMSLLLAGGSKAKKGDPGVPQDHNSVISALEKPGKQRTKLEKRKMAQVISHFEFFQLMKDDEKALEDLCGKISMKRYNENDYIFHQGDHGQIFYVLFSGAVSITSFVPNTIRGEKDIERVWKMLHKGDTFGETALKSEDGKRSANAKCTQSSILLTVECDDFHAIQDEHEVFLREQKLKMVARCPAFSAIEPDILNKVVDKMHIKQYDAQTVITNRGDKAQDLCLIRRGMVKVLKSTPLEYCETDEGRGGGDGLREEESPGIWVIQRNWREIMEPKAKNMTMQETIESEKNNHDFTVGVLGSGEFFGELAVLDETEYSPVTVIACTNVVLYVLTAQDIKDCHLHIDHNLKKYLVESMVTHNPPAHKVAHFFRSKVNWEVRKDRILESCMSEKWIAGKRNSNFLKRIESGSATTLEYVGGGREKKERKTLIEQKEAKEAGTKKVNPKLLKQQFSLKSIATSKKFKF